jgi:hypothetical protein
MIWSTDGSGNRIAKVPQGNFGGYAGWTSMVGGRGERKYINYDKSGLADIGTPTSTTSTRKPSSTTPEVPHAARAALASEMSDSMSDSTPSGPLAGDISVLNPNKSAQFGSLNTSGPMVVR